MARTRFSRDRYRDARWGYCRGLTNRIIDIVVDETKPKGVPRRAWRIYLVSSRKRWAAFGNPTSDHHKSQKTADAVDFRRANDFATRDRVMRRLGVPADIRIFDYGKYTVEHNGRRFRVQCIAGTHGTGPHLHVGVRAL